MCDYLAQKAHFFAMYTERIRGGEQAMQCTGDVRKSFT